MDSLAGRQELADVEKDLAARLHKLMEETDDPILRGPIPRPPGEAEIIERIWRSIRGS